MIWKEKTVSLVRVHKDERAKLFSFAVGGKGRLIREQTGLAVSTAHSGPCRREQQRG